VSAVSVLGDENRVEDRRREELERSYPKGRREEKKEVERREPELGGGEKIKKKEPIKHDPKKAS